MLKVKNQDFDRPKDVYIDFTKDTDGRPIISLFDHLGYEQHVLATVDLEDGALELSRFKENQAKEIEKYGIKMVLMDEDSDQFVWEVND